MKRNRFTRALHHLNKKHVVESAPTNNTLGVFSVSPSGVGPVGWTDREFDTDASGNPLLTGVAADFSAGENPQNFDEAQDTSGLFEDDGVTIKTLSPPGDNSYILGPFATMWYAWGNFTTLGYIQEGTRRMVNLGSIQGKLSDWDGTTLNSYGQLTLEQALWFKNVKKFGGVDNDPANHNYRAYYPGPPSNAPDIWGRYLCSIADSRSIRGTETRPGAPDNPTQPGEMNPFDNFSKMFDFDKRKKDDLSFEDLYDAINDINDFLPPDPDYDVDKQTEDAENIDKIYDEWKERYDKNFNADGSEKTAEQKFNDFRSDNLPNWAKSMENWAKNLPWNNPENPVGKFINNNSWWIEPVVGAIAGGMGAKNAYKTPYKISNNTVNTWKNSTPKKHTSGPNKGKYKDIELHNSKGDLIGKKFKENGKWKTKMRPTNKSSAKDKIDWEIDQLQHTNKSFDNYYKTGKNPNLKDLDFFRLTRVEPGSTFVKGADGKVKFSGGTVGANWALNKAAGAGMGAAAGAAMGSNNNKSNQSSKSNQFNQSSKPNLSNQSKLPASFNEPETGTFEITPADIPDEFKTNNEDKPSAKGVTMTKWMSRTEFMKMYPDSSMSEYLSSLPFGATNFMKPDPNFPGARIVDTKAFERYFMTGDTSGVSGKPKHSKDTPEPEQKKWGGKTKDEILAELDATSEKLTAEEQAAYREMRMIALELGADFASLIGGLFTGGTTAAPVLSKIGVKLLRKYGKTVAGKMIRKLLKKFRNKKNDKIIDDIADAAERGGNDPEAPPRKPFEKDMGDSYQNLSKSGEAKYDTATERLMNQRRLGGKDGELAGRLLDDLNKAAEISDTALNNVLSKIKKSPIGYLFNSYEFNGRVLSESRKHLIREIKKPTTLPKEKKKFKVKPRVLGHPSNSTLSNQMKDVTPNVAFKKEIPVWSMDQKMRNARLSQAKKNDVLEYLGSSGDHWEYMTKTIKEHNKKIIDLNYGGKKKVTRKEQVDKDTIVFMEDEFGNKSNMLQSKINEMQAEAGDKEMFAKYYEMHPVKKKSLFKEVLKRGVFDYKGKPSKKGYPDKEPAKLDPNTGMHPEYGKKYKYDKLDPQSAESMPTQGNPEIDANIAKNLNPESKKRKTKILNQPNG